MLRTFRRLLGAVAVVSSVGVASLVLGPAAHGVAPGSGTATDPATAGQDGAWLVTAHHGNLAEIEAERLAAAQAARTDVQEMGSMLVGDHEALDADLQRLAEELGVVLPAEPRADQRDELAALGAIETAEFDKAWLDAQVAAHRAALAAADAEVEQGTRSAVVDLASTTRDVVQHHLDDLIVLSDEPEAHEGGQVDEPTSIGWMALALLVIVGGVVAGALLLSRGRRRRAGTREGPD